MFLLSWENYPEFLFWEGGGKTTLEYFLSSQTLQLSVNGHVSMLAYCHVLSIAIILYQPLAVVLSMTAMILMISISGAYQISSYNLYIVERFAMYS